MEFNSFEFVLFFLTFFFLYWFVFNRNVRYQNILLLVGSCIFYSWWNWKFLAILLISALINYLLGLMISQTDDEKRKSLYVYVSVFQGLGTLFFFKYFNFFITSVSEGLSALNFSVNINTLAIILPLGISFYTFRTISYILDVNNEKIQATKDWVVFFNYVTFFPSLLAGPIDRAGQFIPQLESKRQSNYQLGVDGLRQILWGLFKKVVIADNCFVITNQIFNNYDQYSASTLLLAAFLNIIQIYADFSGYSDMAIGLAKLLGFNVSKNFHYPFFAKNIADFWQRWHMSLTNWMTEYVYTPLSFIFRKHGKWGIVLAIIINFIIVGFWHGANWTFILFGLLHGLYFIPLIISGTLSKKIKVEKETRIQKIKGLFNMLTTFLLVMLTAIIFTSTTIQNSIGYFSNLLSLSIFQFPEFPLGLIFTIKLMLLIFFMFLIEWIEKDESFPLKSFAVKWPKILRYFFYYLLMIIIIIFMGKQQEFIYFQF